MAEEQKKPDAGKSLASLLPSVVAVAVAVTTTLSPEIQSWLSDHPSVAAVIAGLYAVLAHMLPSPVIGSLGKSLPIVLLAALFFVPTQAKADYILPFRQQINQRLKVLENAQRQAPAPQQQAPIIIQQPVPQIIQQSPPPYNLGPPPQQQIPFGPPPQQQIPLGPPPQQQIPLGQKPQQEIPLGSAPQQQIPLGPPAQPIQPTPRITPSPAPAPQEPQAAPAPTPVPTPQKPLAGPPEVSPAPRQDIPLGNQAPTIPILPSGQYERYQGWKPALAKPVL